MSAVALRVVIVDDSTDLAGALAEEMRERTGAEALVFSGKDEFFAWYRPAAARGERIDALVLDLAFDGERDAGLKLLSQIADGVASENVIVFTAFDFSDVRVRLRDKWGIDAERVFSKGTVPLKAVVAALEDVLRRARRRK